MQRSIFNNVFRASNAKGKRLVSYLGVRNQVANCRLKLRGFKAKMTVGKMYSKIEHNKEDLENVLRELKARSKVQMMYFTVKMTEASYVILSKAYKFTSKLLLGF